MIRFFGRSDTKVKLHWKRIELGEVEHVRAGFPEGAAVFKIVKPAGNHARSLLAALVCNKPGKSKSILVNCSLLQMTCGAQVEAARTHVLPTLPRHMGPSPFLRLNDILSSMDRKTVVSFASSRTLCPELSWRSSWRASTNRFFIFTFD